MVRFGTRTVERTGFCYFKCIARASWCRNPRHEGSHPHKIPPRSVENGRNLSRGFGFVTHLYHRHTSNRGSKGRKKKRRWAKGRPLWEFSGRKERKREVIISRPALILITNGLVDKHLSAGAKTFCLSLSGMTSRDPSRVAPPSKIIHCVISSLTALLHWTGNWQKPGRWRGHLPFDQLQRKVKFSRRKTNVNPYYFPSHDRSFFLLSLLATSVLVPVNRSQIIPPSSGHAMDQDQSVVPVRSCLSNCVARAVNQLGGGS
jgi:hypothetical protein